MERKIVTLDNLEHFYGKLQFTIKDELAQKQDTINDLETIRQGAAKGATSIQAVNTGDVVDDVTIEYATKSYVDGLVGDINSVLESIING